MVDAASHPLFRKRQQRASLALWKILMLKAQGHEVIEQAHAMAFTDARRFEAMIQQAKELEQEEGKESRSEMPV
jgi:hypothetical protein